MNQIKLRNHPEVYRFGVNYLNENEINLINSLSMWEKVVPKEKAEVLKDIREQCQDIVNDLIPLIKYGVFFNIFLAGGAVRDFILGRENQIKDLDIVVSFKIKDMVKPPNLKDFEKEKEFNLDLPDLKKVIYKDSDKKFDDWASLKLVKDRVNPRDGSIMRSLVNERFHHNKKIVFFDLLAIALAQNNNLFKYYPPNKMVPNKRRNKIIKSYSDDDREVKGYLETKILGVLKISNSKWKWPVDILCSTSSVYGVLDSFDFNICKVAINILTVEDIYMQNYVYPKTNKDFLKNLFFTNAFLNSVSKKSLSLNENIMTVNLPHVNFTNVRLSLEKHYPRLKEKYDWKFYYNERSEDITQEIKNYINSFILKYDLDKSMEAKETKEKRVLLKV